MSKECRRDSLFDSSTDPSALHEEKSSTEGVVNARYLASRFPRSLGYLTLLATVSVLVFSALIAFFGVQIGCVTAPSNFNRAFTGVNVTLNGSIGKLSTLSDGYCSSFLKEQKDKTNSEPPCAHVT